MRQRLSKDQKTIVAKNYSDNPFFRSIRTNCKVYERKMSKLAFCPEEIFMETLSCLDTIKEDIDHAEVYCTTLYDELYCDYRGMRDEVPDEELDLATQLVMLCVAGVLGSQEDRFYQFTLMNRLLEGLNNACPFDTPTERINLPNRIVSRTVFGWAKEYMQSSQFISKDIDELLYPSMPEPSTTIELSDAAEKTKGFTARQWGLLLYFTAETQGKHFGGNDNNIEQSVGKSVLATMTGKSPSSFTDVILPNKENADPTRQVIKDITFVANTIKEVLPKTYEEMMLFLENFGH